MKYFEYFAIGLEEEAPGRHVVTEEEIIEFGTRWDSQPFHVDPEAAKNSVFGGLVADRQYKGGLGCTATRHNKLVPRNSDSRMGPMG